MPKVTYGGQSYDCEESTVLDCLTAQGISVPSSCRSGLCQTCMMKVVSGNIPGKSRAGLSDALIAQNYFLPCVCNPEEDIEVILPDSTPGKIQVQVSSIEYLNANIIGIKLKPSLPFEYRPGQFINFFKDENTARSYSLASVPELEDDLFINVRKVPGGVVSGWISEHLKPGDTVTISAATGNCFYVSGNPEQNILLIGTGSGLAPLSGIIRAALHHGHQGKISLYHGSYTREGLYLTEELRNLAQSYSNFSYFPCVSGEATDEQIRQGMVFDVAIQDNPSLKGWRVFLCGHPEMVKSAQRETFFAGASMRDILADPFG